MVDPVAKSEVVITKPADADLKALAVAINAGHAEVEAAGRTTLEKARWTGERLLNAKAACSHGKWKGWLGANVKFSERTAQQYMRVSREWAKAQSTALLSDALKMLTEKAQDGDDLTRLAGDEPASRLKEARVTVGGDRPVQWSDAARANDTTSQPSAAEAVSDKDQNTQPSAGGESGNVVELPTDSRTTVIEGLRSLVATVSSDFTGSEQSANNEQIKPAPGLNTARCEAVAVCLRCPELEKRIEVLEQKLVERQVVPVPATKKPVVIPKMVVFKPCKGCTNTTRCARLGASCEACRKASARSVAV